VTIGDKVFGILAIILGIAIVVVAVLGVLVTPWVVIGASSLGIAWMTVARRRALPVRRGSRSSDRRA
jgi:hypothetical protein